MSNIEENLKKILNSRFGKDVRQAIHDGIEQCYLDMSTNSEAFVNKWMSEHPEVTTTVQDESLSKNKFTKSLREVAIGKINAVEYGFDNTGEAANDVIMQRYIDEDADTPIWFPSGIYAFNESIIFGDDVYVDCDSNCIWQLVNDIDVPFIQFKRTKWGTNRNCYFKNAYVDVNFHADIGIGFAGTKYFECCPKVVSNFKLYGVQTGYETFNDESCGALWFHHCLFVNDTYISNTVAIYDNAPDNRFSDIIIRDVTQGIYAGSGRYSNIHHWVMNDAENSLFAYVFGENAFFTNIYADTLHTIFNADDWKFVNAQGISVYYNPDYYPEELFVSNPPVLFKNTEKVTYNISNLMFRVYHDCYFGDSGNYNSYSNFSNVVMYNQNDDTDIKNLPENVKDYRELNGSSDFDNVNPGVYNVNTYSGTGGNNVPENAYGLLGMIATNNKKAQIVCGNGKIMMRRYVDNVWGDWITFLPPTEIQIQNIKLDGSSNFDDCLDENARYEVNTYSGTGGNNVPENAFGIMRVLKCGEYMISQSIYGTTGIYQRLYSSNAWSSWIKIAAET